MIVGDSVLDPNYVETRNKAVLAISQLLKFNMVRNKRCKNITNSNGFVHSKEQGNSVSTICGVDDTL